MAKKKKKDEDSEKETKTKKKEEEISVDQFTGSVKIHPRRAYFLKKKYRGQKHTRKQWEKLCKEENISL